MTPDEIAAEMRRKPDAQLLIEWIADYVLPIGDPVVGPIEAAIGAYLDAQDC